MAAGYGTSAFGKVLLALAGAWPMVLVARFTDRVGNGLRGSPRVAIISDDTTAANRGPAFGLHRAADTSDAVALYVTSNLSYAALSYPAGVISDRRTCRGVYAIGLALFAVAYVSFGVTDRAGWMWVLFPLYGTTQR